MRETMKIKKFIFIDKTISLNKIKNLIENERNFEIITFDYDSLFVVYSITCTLYGSQKRLKSRCTREYVSHHEVNSRTGTIYA